MLNVIYTLSCPDTGAVRYVGKSKRPRCRLNAHIARARRGSKTHCARWIKSVLDRGAFPVFAIVEGGVSDDQWCAAERRWIAHFRRLGFDLTNKTEGGEGGATYGRLGKTNSPEHRAKCSAARLGRQIKQTRSEARTSAVAAAIAAKKARGESLSWGGHTDETKAKMSQLGRSDVFLANIRKAAAASAEARRGKPARNRGKPPSDETKRKISAAKIGRPWSAARRAAHEGKLNGPA